MISSSLIHRRVKILATAGPSLSSKEELKKAIQSGANVIRLNFSHGKTEEHLSKIKNIKDLSKELQVPIGILQDLQGPKIRIGQFKEKFIDIKEGQKVFLFFSDSKEYQETRQDHIPMDFKPLFSACQPENKILIDDGLLELKVNRLLENKIECLVLNGGRLKDKKGIHFPEISFPMLDPLTSKDLKDLEFGLSQSVDYVALSYVRTAKDITKLRNLIEKKNKHSKIIAKIEVSESLNHLEEIIRLSDGVMVARGDLTVEVGQTQLPRIQKKIIKACNRLRRPVITATQMLDSMVENPRPTRAEVTDVANAVLDGSDALMLSQETATGKRPFDCIKTMSDIVLDVERNEDDYYYNFSFQEKSLNVSDSIGASACFLALKVKASAIICLTTTGQTATVISSFRPKAKIIAATHQIETLNRLSLIWGIQTIFIKPYKKEGEAMTQVEELLLKNHVLKKGDKAILTLGLPVLSKAKTNSLRVYIIGSKLPS